VVGPTKAEMAQIKEILRQAVAECNDDPTVFMELANEGLANFGVQFKRGLKLPAGVAGMADHEGIYLVPPERYMLASGRLEDFYGAVIYHELVHGWQLAGMKDPKMVSDRATNFMMKDGQVDQDKYLRQKQETMAHAASLVDSWERQGMNAQQMKTRLKRGNWGFAEKYWQAKERLPTVFNYFCKCAIGYIDKLEQ
jgi:hypothetical protein